jgi:predicted regulator of Ras-like GTPase activity (Roadblock/LC7/MglB family)
MSTFAQRGLLLREHLLGVCLRWRGLRGLVLVDAAGLPLASTFKSRSLEERVAALASLGVGWIERARDELEIGPPQTLRLGAQDRQLFLVPVQPGVVLAAVAEADAGALDLERQLLATARDLLALPAGDAVRGPAETHE